jgi:hypothetical protein
MKGALAILVVTAAFWGCKPGSILAPGALKRAFESLPRSPLCAQNVPADWVSTWPVPTSNPDEFRAYFYELDRRAADNSGFPLVRVSKPRGEAVFKAGGQASVCTATSADIQIIKGERYGDEAMSMEEDDFEKASTRLLGLTEIVGGFYARQTKRPDPRALSEFWKLFQIMAEPALLREYYEANPAFWEWLRANNKGQSLPKPA